MQAVVTADIVNSTCLSNDQLSSLLKNIKGIFGKMDKVEFFRGDSYQAYVHHGESVLRKATICRLYAKSYEEGARIDIRQSISLGEGAKPVDHIGLHIDPLFIASGRSFDKMNEKNGDWRTVITIKDYNEDPIYETVYGIVSKYLDHLIEKLTTNQAVVLRYLFQGKSQKEIAESLDKSPSTISRLMHAGKFGEMESLISDFEKLTQMISANGQ